MTEFDVGQMKALQEIKLLRPLDTLTGFLEIMVFLRKFEIGNLSHFVKDLRLNQSPTERTLRKLIEIGLAETADVPQPKRKGRKAKYYRLTTTGRALGDELVAMFETYRQLRS